MNPVLWLALLPVAGSAFVIAAHLLLLARSKSHHLDPERLADYWIITAYSLTFGFYTIDFLRSAFA
jgi:hypothetical protein